MVDRFDLKFVFRRNTDIEQIRKYALRKAEIGDKKQPDYTPFLVKYIEYAKRINPKILDEAKFMLVEFFANLSFKGFGTNRVLETLFRISKAIARLKLKEIVDSQDARETIAFYNIMLQDYQEVTTTPEDPRDTAIRELIITLKEKQSGITFDELIKEVCENNEYVSRYLGFGHRSLQIKDNKKVKVLLEMIIKNPNVKRTNYRPIVLQWFESEAEAARGSDPNDLCDLQKTNRIEEGNQEIIESNNIASNISDIGIGPNEKSRSLGSYRSLPPALALDPALDDSNLMYDCYVCIKRKQKRFRTNDKLEYENHGQLKHPGKPCYPGKADLEFYNWKPQNKEWEI